MVKTSRRWTKKGKKRSSRIKSRSKSRQSKSRSRNKSKSRSRNKSFSKSRSRSKARSRTRSKSRSRTRSKSRSRSKARSRTRSKSRSRSKARSRTRSKSRSRVLSRPKSRTRTREKSRTIRGGGKSDLNPINLKPYSKRYYELQEQVRERPAAQPAIKRELFKLLDQTDVILLTGDTGSGKTTVVPGLLWEYFDYSISVVCTQPRILTSVGVATRVAQELDIELGKDIGFRFRGSDELLGGNISGPATLTYMTQGTLLNNTFKRPSSLVYYGAVLIDEAHDREISTDLLMFYIREALSTINLTCKFVIMSATLDKEIFMDYFQDYNIKHFHIPGRTFQVDSRFLSKSIYQDVIQSGQSGKIYQQVEKMVKHICTDIVKTPDKRKLGDILIFLPVIRLLKSFQEMLQEHFQALALTNYEIVTISGETPKDQHSSIINIIPGKIKIVLSTPVAETGITINGVYYVIDSGLSFQPKYDMIKRLTTLEMKFISQAEVKQRKGRAGRMKPGMCFHLYTPEEYQNFIPFRKPEIYRSNFDTYLLRLFYQFKNLPDGSAYVKEVLNLMLSPPHKEDVQATMKFFHRLNLLSNEYDPNLITDVGECFQQMDLDLDLTHLFLVGTAYEIEMEIWADMITILGLGSNLGKWFTTRGLPEEFKQPYMNKYGDLIGLYHIYLDYKSEKLPQDYVKLLQTRLFDKIEEKSEELQQSPIVQSFFCTDSIPTKYEIKADMYLNIVSAFRQAWGDDRIVAIKDLQLFRYKNSFIDLAAENKVIALSKVSLETFGKAVNVYDNFMRII